MLDSLVHPDGFKIHINEVCFSDYDPLCAVRGLTPGELVGSYCRQMYEIVQSFRPGAPMRTYGDPFDIWVSDPRLHPVDTPPWTAGSLQELSPTIEILAMADYTDNLDSSFSYFAANNHPSIMSGGEKNGLPKFVDGALKARQWSSTCRGLSIYGWGTSQFDDLLPGAADLAWNVGPYIVHTPVVFTNQPSTVTIQAEMWTDDFRESPAPVLTIKRVRYRLLPSGSWTNVTMGNVGTDTYSATISLGSPSNTGIEYYIETTDTRVQTRRAPYSAPTETFVALFPPGGGPEGVPGYVELDYVINMIASHPEVSWPAAADADWYEVHLGDEPDLSPGSATLVARQQLCCPRYLFAGGEARRVDVDRIHVFAVRETPQQPIDPRKAIE